MEIKNLKQLHKFVGERDSYICQVCHKDFNFPCYFDENDLNTYICAHHEATRGAHPSEALNPDICIAICQKCHQTIKHS